MTKIFTLILFVSLANITFAKKSYLDTTKYDCIEISKFTSDKKHANTRALKRASRIPSDVVANIQTFMVDEVDLDTNGLKALHPDDSTCENIDSALTLDGVVIDYKKGNRIVRYVVSFGAGKQKIEANLTLKEKATGKILAQGRVVDRKIAGFVGGSENKGKRDFAEKVNNFIRDGIQLKKTLKR